MDSLLSLVGARLLAIVSAVLLGALVIGCPATYLVGHHKGGAAVQAQWDTAKAAQAARETGIAQAVGSLSTQLVAAFEAKLEGLDHQQQEALDAAHQADVAPVDERCRDVRRGVPSGVVRSLGRIR